MKGLLAANEMAERACSLVRQQLAEAREEAKGLLAAKEQAERGNELLRGELAQCQENFLRATAKRRIWLVRAFREVRRFGRRLSRRS